MLNKSRVIDTRKPITSRTGASRAAKARETLYTAMTTLRTSGEDYAADLVSRQVVAINLQLKAYYEAERDRLAAKDGAPCVVCQTAVEVTGKGELVHANRHDVANNHIAAVSA